jgi:ParB/RepB/Spo0J family partition protein
MPTTRIKTSDAYLPEDLPREQVDPAHVRRLADTLRKGGELNPPKAIRKGARYEISCGGAHRLLAHREAGREEMDVLLVERPLTQGDILLEQYQENEHRLGFNHRELARLFVALRAEFGWTQEELAEQLGISPARVSKVLAVSRRLAPDLQDRVATGELCPTIAYLLCPLDHPQQRELAARGLKREAVEREVKKRLGRRVRKARPTKITTAGGVVLLVPDGCDYDAVLDDLREAMKRLRKGRKLGEDAEAAPVLLPV